MRISDWSSDVCSSDLAAVRLPGPRRESPSDRRRRTRPALGCRGLRRVRKAPLALAAAGTGRDRAGPARQAPRRRARDPRSEEHTSELQSLMRISYAVFCLKKKTYKTIHSTLATRQK